MESQEQIDNANLLLTKHRLKLEWNQMVWSVNNLRCGTAAISTKLHGQIETFELTHPVDTVLVRCPQRGYCNSTNSLRGRWMKSPGIVHLFYSQLTMGWQKVFIVRFLVAAILCGCLSIAVSAQTFRGAING